MIVPVFPTEVQLEYPIRMRDNFKVLVNQSEGGVEQRLSKWTRPIREIEATCYLMDRSVEADVLRNFFFARKGTFEPFLFISPHKRSMSGEYIGVGDGSRRVWRLPFINSSFFTIYVNGVEKYWGPDYEIYTGVVSGGTDSIVIRTAPTVGQIITCDFSDGQFVPYVRLAEAYEDEYMYYNRYSARLRFVEVKEDASPY